MDNVSWIYEKTSPNYYNQLVKTIIIEYCTSTISFALFPSSGINCTPPGIDDFPKDQFTEEQRRNGAVVVHILVSLYLFLALAVVCDKYFVPAVEKICHGKIALNIISIHSQYWQIYFILL